MRTGAFVSAVAGLITLAGADLLGEDTATKAPAERIARLIRELGDEAFPRREAASRKLKAVGAPALPALCRAAAGADPEVRHRAERLIREVGRRVPFDGTHLLLWQTRDGKPARWKVEKSYLEVVPGQGDILTKCVYGDCRLHVEFQVPEDPHLPPGERGNSGIYLQGRYEIQILDSWGKNTPAANDCGALWGQIAPRKNACKPAGRWQTLDITFRAPRLNAAGNVTEKGVVTVVLNGVTVIDRGTFNKVCPMGLDDRPGGPGPILLQDHRSRVRFRNIRVTEP